MKTNITSETKTFIIDTNGPFTNIGEKINPTGRKKLAEPLKEHNFDYDRGLVLKQVEASADILDVNLAFLSLAITFGATCAITDPMKLSLTIRAVDLLRGRDDYAGRYIKHYRKLAAENES